MCTTSCCRPHEAAAVTNRAAMYSDGKRGQPGLSSIARVIFKIFKNILNLMMQFQTNYPANKTLKKHIWLKTLIKTAYFLGKSDSLPS